MTRLWEPWWQIVTTACGLAQRADSTDASQMVTLNATPSMMAYRSMKSERFPKTEMAGYGWRHGLGCVSWFQNRTKLVPLSFAFTLRRTGSPAEILRPSTNRPTANCGLG